MERYTSWLIDTFVGVGAEIISLGLSRGLPEVVRTDSRPNTPKVKVPKSEKYVDERFYKKALATLNK